MCATQSFLLLATRDHWPWGEREKKAKHELLNPELLERAAIFLCPLFFPGVGCCESFCRAVRLGTGTARVGNASLGGEHLLCRVSAWIPCSTREMGQVAGMMAMGRREEQFASRAHDKNQLERQENKI